MGVSEESSERIKDPESLILCKIVHLSDLHFGSSRFDKSLWRMLTASLEKHKPLNLIVVTGDIVNNPRFKSFRLAKNNLQELAKNCEAKLITVPGNHDLALLGNDMTKDMTGLSLINSVVWVILFPLNFLFFRLIGRLGYKAYFEHEEDSKSFFKRLLKVYPSIIKNWIFTKIKGSFSTKAYTSSSKWEESILKILDDYEVLIVPFDSNGAPWFASGRINLKEIYALSSLMAKISARGDHFVRRIALVHHHPVPIPYVSDKEKLTDFEPLLSFRNAGTFLAELFKYNFDLVLHGHRHLPNFMRINFNHSGNEGDLGVLSAGSATIRNNERGRNSYNLITIYKNGHFYLDQILYGNGQGIPSGPSGKDLFTVEGLKLNAFRRSVEAQGFSFEKVEIRTVISWDGTSTTSWKCQDLRITGEIEKTGRDHVIAVDKGRILYCRADDNSKKEVTEICNKRGMTGTCPTPIPCKECRLRVKFNQALNKGTPPPPFTYGIKYRTQSSHAMSKQEALRLGLPSDTVEGSAIRIPCPVKSLHLIVEFPDDYSIPDPELRIRFNPDLLYSCSINDEGEFNLDPQQPIASVPDPLMQKYEKAHLSREGKNAWVLSVEYPIVGYEYEIIWGLPNEPVINTTHERPRIEGEVAAYQRLLLRYRNARKDGAELSNINDIQILLRSLHNDLKRVYGSFEPELFSVSIMTVDLQSEPKRLVMVDSVNLRNTYTAPDFEFWLELGVGNAGHAYKTGIPILYDAKKVDEDNRYYLPSSTHDEQYEVLWSIPLYHPNIFVDLSRTDLRSQIRRPLSPAIVAILNIGSNSSASPLRNLQNEDEMTQLYRICQLTLDSILAKLRVTNVE